MRGKLSISSAPLLFTDVPAGMPGGLSSMRSVRLHRGTIPVIPVAMNIARFFGFGYTTNPYLPRPFRAAFGSCLVGTWFALSPFE